MNPEENTTPLSQAAQVQGEHRFSNQNLDTSGRPNLNGLGAQRGWQRDESLSSLHQAIILPDTGLETSLGLTSRLQHHKPFGSLLPVFDVPNHQPQLVRPGAGPDIFIPHYPEPFETQFASVTGVPGHDLYYDTSRIGLGEIELSRNIIQKEILSPVICRLGNFICPNHYGGNHIGLGACSHNCDESPNTSWFNRYPCTFQTRSNVGRNHESTRIQKKKQVLTDCPVPGCRRVGENGFNRRDNMLQHRRGVHGEYIQKKYMRFGQVGSPHRGLRDVGKK